jgi:hypothetical protein
MSNLRITKPVKRDRWLRIQRGLLLVLFGAFVCSGIGLWNSRRDGQSSRARNSADDAAPRNQPVGDGMTELSQARSAATDGIIDGITLVDDDGKTLWMSPTNGRPLDLSYLPTGCQVYVALNWSKSFSTPERLKVLLTAGPLTAAVRQFNPHIFGARSDWYNMPLMTVGLCRNSSGGWSMSRVVSLRKPLTEPQKSFFETLFDGKVREHNGYQYGIIGDYARYLSPAADRVVVAPDEKIGEIIDSGGSPPPLRRDTERLLKHTDADRHVTVIFAPSVSFSKGEQVFVGQMSPLRKPLFWFFGDEFSAVALSLHWDENFFIELQAVPTLDTSPETATRILMERLAQVPGKLESYLATLEPQPYGREILARFPEMVRTMVKYARSGFDADHAVLRCYLPAAAGHNLLLGAELTLAEGASAGHGR